MSDESKTDPVKVVHLQSGAGTARCGRPAKLEDIRIWGDDAINCDACVRAYTAAIRMPVRA